MLQSTFAAADAPALAPGARRYGLTCVHGATSAVMLPGGKLLADLVVLDVLLARHHRLWRCTCPPALIGPMPDAMA
jgi:hypothetical protein